MLKNNNTSKIFNYIITKYNRIFKFIKNPKKR